MKTRQITYKILKSGCWLCTSHKLCGQGYVTLTINHNRVSGHRQMYIQKYGKINNQVLRHTCDNRWCINPDHLIEGSHNDNVQDRVFINRSAVGEANGRSKLTEKEVIEILNNIELTNTELSKKYNVDTKVIRNIKNRISWKYLDK